MRERIRARLHAWWYRLIFRDQLRFTCCPNCDLGEDDE